MGTISYKEILDKIIEGKGYYEDDARVMMIVEYTDMGNQRVWGTVDMNEGGIIGWVGKAMEYLNLKDAEVYWYPKDEVRVDGGNTLRIYWRGTLMGVVINAKVKNE